MIITFTLLTLALISLWLPVKPFQWRIFTVETWHIFGGCAVIAGLIDGCVQPLGLLFLCLFTIACYGTSRLDTPLTGRIICGCLTFGLTVGFFLHQVPGFSNHLVVDSVRLSADAMPYKRYLNFDKAWAGLMLCGLTLPRFKIQKGWWTMTYVCVRVAIITVPLILVLSVVLGFVRFDPKWTQLFWLWAWSNLFLTCIAEEAFFRGFIQRGLVQLFGKFRYGQFIGVILAAALFGLGHLAGGWSYVLLAAVAGLAYGWLYHRTGKIESAILLHFTVNLVHFLFFTYPALER